MSVRSRRLNLAPTRFWFGSLNRPSVARTCTPSCTTWRRPAPCWGHEIAGRIAKLGSEIEGWEVGNRVVAGGGDPPPGSASPMRDDPRYNYRTMGFGGSRTGDYAEFTLVEGHRLQAVPDAVSDEVAALTEPCSVAVHAVRRSAVKLGDTVAVLGAGPIGLLCLQAARAAGRKPSARI